MSWPTIDVEQPEVYEDITGNDLLLKAIHLMHEDDTDIYEDFALTWVQLTVQDLFEANAGLRAKKGFTEISLLQLVPKEMSEVIHLEPELLLAAVYGVMLKVYAQEDNKSLYSTYLQLYENEKLKFRRNRMTFVSDGGFF